MKNSKSRKKYGFTLIELMVAVIIIAVLAAVAVPQYKKAVLKSRYSTLMPVANSLAKGNEVYYLSQGEYSKQESKLDVEGQLSVPEGTEIVLETDPEYLSYVRVSNESKVPNARYVVYQQHSKNFAGTTMCEAKDDTAKELCQSLGGVFVSANGTDSGWSSYLLSGELQAGDAFEVPCPANSTECNNDGEATGCENGYYIDGGACSACPENSTCNSNTGAITGCTPGYYKQGGTCVAQVTSSTSCETSSSSNTSCRNVHYTGINDTQCSAYVSYGCEGATFSGWHASCKASGSYGCDNTTYTGLYSYCSSNGPNGGCRNSTFYGGSFCAGDCADTTYLPDASGKLGCCGGDNCPVGVPSCETQYISGYYMKVPDGNWHGDCCNPDAVGGIENCGGTQPCS